MWYDSLYQHPSGAAAYSTWMLKCDRPGHVDCLKNKTTVAANIRRHGIIEPLAFLHSWLEMPEEAGTPHSLQKVNVAMVDAYARDAGERPNYEACCAQWGATVG